MRTVSPGLTDKLMAGPIASKTAPSWAIVGWSLLLKVPAAVWLNNGSLKRVSRFIK
ncbi:MAG: hypothetical protein HC819_23030 [Cyclobacteriaceae bacterium]|nr:hypothetical protein [Cyclobacteriaceae bacterium]